MFVTVWEAVEGLASLWVLLIFITLACPIATFRIQPCLAALVALVARWEALAVPASPLLTSITRAGPIAPLACSTIGTRR